MRVCDLKFISSFWDYEEILSRLYCYFDNYTIDRYDYGYEFDVDGLLDGPQFPITS